MSKLSILWLGIFIVHVFSSQSCKYVDDLEVYFYASDKSPEYSKWEGINITGCISDRSFNFKKVRGIGIDCKIGGVPRLERNFINNMDFLREISIGACQVEIIEPGAFANLPKIEKIEIYLNPITNLSSGVFNFLPNLQEILLGNNEITNIEDYAFANLSKLKGISLRGNRLKYLNKKWFTNTTNIEICSLMQNSIRTVPSKMFHGWKRLKMLKLNSNAISSIKGKLFKKNAPIMDHVLLHHNRLTTLSIKTFSNSVYIKELGISGNLFNYLPEEFLRKIRVSFLYIFGNPFSCPCLDKINSIFLERRLGIDDLELPLFKSCRNFDVPVCGYSNNSRKCSESVDSELTQRILSYMKKIQYHTVRDEDGQQCAMFDTID